MLRIVGVVALVLVVLAGCGGRQQSIGELQARRQDLKEELRELTLAPLRAFLAESPPNCASPNLAHARSSALTEVSLLDPNVNGFDMVFESGEDVLSVADAARSRGCKDVARDLYDSVISTFIGAGYAALRERARIGIDDVRFNTGSAPILPPPSDNITPTPGSPRERIHCIFKDSSPMLILPRDTCQQMGGTD